MTLRFDRAEKPPHEPELEEEELDEHVESTQRRTSAPGIFVAMTRHTTRTYVH